MSYFSVTYFYCFFIEYNYEVIHNVNDIKNIFMK